MTKKVFEGVKIADFTWVWAGPITTKTFADYGAEVIKIETGTRPTPGGGGRDAASFKQFNTNKMSVSLNLGTPRGKELAKKLVAWADIVAENMTAGAMKRMGLGYDELKKIKPDIIMLSSSLQGQTGPYANMAGMGTVPTYLSGMNHLTGWPDREPAELGPYSDFIAPHFCAGLISAALDYRRRTGKGQYIDISMLEVALQFQSPAVMDYSINKRTDTRIGNHIEYAAPHNAYPCLGEDKWCSISVFNDKEWQSLCKVMGKPALAADSKFATLMARKANEDELDKIIGEWTAKHTSKDVMTLLQKAGVAAAVIQDFQEISDDPQFAARKFLDTHSHPENPERFARYRALKAHFILSKVPRPKITRSAMLGEHNEYVLKKVIGLNDEEIVQLVIDGVIA